MVCKNCGRPLVNVMSFSKEGNRKYCRCPECRWESKKQNLRKDELTFNEYLYKAMRR